MKGTLFTAAIAVTLGACAGDAAPPGNDASGPAADSGVRAAPSVRLVDSTIPPAVAGQEGWNYQQTAEADLNGDGDPERIVLTARVELVRGRPAWDDGQPWQVYLESSGGVRTYVYAQRLQLGALEMRVTRSGPGAPATVLLLEHLPDRLRLFEVSSTGPGAAAVTELFARDLDPRGDLASPRLP